jgi:hypothetical protein
VYQCFDYLKLLLSIVMAEQEAALSNGFKEADLKPEPPGTERMPAEEQCHTTEGPNNPVVDGGTVVSGEAKDETEETVKTGEAIKTEETGETGDTSNDDEESLSTEKQKSDVPPPPITRVGIQYTDKSVTRYQDWSLRAIEPTLQSKLADQFDITVDLNGDIKLRSRFLVDIFRKVVKYYPGILNDSATLIVIGKPYAALYHYWDDLRAAIEAQIEACGEAKGGKIAPKDGRMVSTEESSKDSGAEPDDNRESTQEVNQDAYLEKDNEGKCVLEDTEYGSSDPASGSETAEQQTLRSQLEILTSVYKTFCAADHNEARGLMQNNLITFKNLWAVYKPGELLLSKDQFGEPVLHSFTACAVRSGFNLRNMMTMAMLSPSEIEHALKGPGIWNIDGWSVQWDGSTKTFTRVLKTFVVSYFPGAKTITSIEPYPMKLHTDSHEAEDIAIRLKDRGHRWRGLITSRPSCHMYKGPAFKIKPFFNKPEKNRTNVRSYNPPVKILFLT